MCSNYDYVVICILVRLKRIARIIIVVLRIVVALWLMLLLMTWLCLIYRVTEETLVGAVHCGRLRLHKRVLQGIAQVNARLAD